MSSDGRFINGVVERNSTDERNHLPMFSEEDECGSRPSTLPLVKSKRKSDYNLKRQESIEKFNQVLKEISKNLISFLIIYEFFRFSIVALV